MPRKKDRFAKRNSKIIARMAKEIVCEAHGLSHVELLGPDRGGAHQAFARQISMYLSHVVGRLTLAEIAQTFDRDRSTVSHACINIEDRRDSPIFDLQIDYMEKRLRDRLMRARRDGVFKQEGWPPFERKSLS